MVVRIINDEPHKSVVKEVVCTNCGVTLEYTPNDTIERNHTDYVGDTNVFRVVPCPKCHHEQVVRRK